MTTSASPRRIIETQARKIVSIIKAVERDTLSPTNAWRLKIAEARKKSTFIFGIAMDDKFIKIEMEWTLIDKTGEEELIEFIVKAMQNKMEKPN